MPIAILLSLGIAAGIYVLIALQSVLILSPEQLQASEAPLAGIYKAATAREPWFISIISLFAVVNGALIQIIMGSRVSYGLAKQGLLSKMFSRLHPRTQTPIIATCIIAGLIIVAALWLPIETLAKITSYLLLILFCAVNLALIKIKHRDAVPVPASVFSTPIFVPFAGFMSCALLLIVQTWSVLRGLIGI